MAKPTPRKQSSAPVGGKKSFREKQGKPNGSILSFFKKVEVEEDGLFVGGGDKENSDGLEVKRRQEEPDFDDLDGLFGATPRKAHGEGERFNENESSNKRRRMSDDGAAERLTWTNSPEAADAKMGEKNGCTPPPPQEAQVKKKQPKRRGAFIDDSDSEDDATTYTIAQPPSATNGTAEIPIPITSAEASESEHRPPKRNSSLFSAKSKLKRKATSPTTPSLPTTPSIPTLKHTPSSTSLPGALSKQDSIADDTPTPLHDNDYADGEEMVERKWMEEQDAAMFRTGELDEHVSKTWDPGEWEGDFDPDEIEVTEEVEEKTCPICSANLEGIVERDAERHVNGCLDGKSVPVETLKRVEAEAVSKNELKSADSTPQLKREDSCSATPLQETKKHPGQRFSKAAIAKPGQKSPFDLSTPSGLTGSAFSKLMTGNAESSAWKEAAAAESSARGKPAAQRTCPFYKILPGFNICVDAFRYGAVEGCNAYFLSHFHSDHYIGLTSSWCHGPIYASTITARLCVQQLRVDPKWMVPIAFEEKVEVPGTDGVSVTMISANHCPGSSLFLYEKVVGKGADPKIHRVLHCGDFRACPEHMKHPLLMPDVVDKATVRLKSQRIDVCYLDTTYLNPKYAFPSQEAVIKSCADMCVSLSKDIPDPGDAWEVAKRERAGKGMTQFVTGAVTIKEEDGEVITPLAEPSTATNGKPKSRGRLLVVCGTYSIGKERICLGIARALDCKIYAPPAKRKICAALEDSELMERLTDDPLEAQVHMQMIMEIRPETLKDYLTDFKNKGEGGFTRIVGFRPSGWNYRPPSNRFLESPQVSTVLYGNNWKSGFSMQDMVPQRGSTREAACYGVPYSEHSSFRELTMFVCGLRIEKIIPTVNVGSENSRRKMAVWIERWLAERRKNGVVRFGQGEGEVRW